MTDADRAYLLAFARESNAIENIADERRAQIHAETLEWFVALPEITIAALEAFVKAVEPGAHLRTKGERVQVGRHVPPDGDVAQKQLADLLATFRSGGEREIWTGPNPGRNAWRVHVCYESIHPFTDGNGRSGRALWLWQMRDAAGGRLPALTFLRSWYYATLDAARTA